MFILRRVSDFFFFLYGSRSLDLDEKQMVGQALLLHLNLCFKETEMYLVVSRNPTSLENIYIYLILANTSKISFIIEAFRTSTLESAAPPRANLKLTVSF